LFAVVALPATVNLPASADESPAFRSGRRPPDNRKSWQFPAESALPLHAEACHPDDASPIVAQGWDDLALIVRICPLLSFTHRNRDRTLNFVPETQVTGDILTIRQLAEYLMVSEKTVYRMLDRNELPAMRVGSQWRFRKQDIDTWLTDEVRRVEYEGQRGALEAFEMSEMAITPLLAPDNVWLSVMPASRDELLAFLTREASIDTHVDRDQLFRSMREREEICSTAVLEGAAFPHPVDPRPFRFTRKRVLLAVLREPLDFLDPHGHRPRVVAAILARSVQGQLLAFSRAIKLFADPILLKRLQDAQTPAEALGVIGAAEALISRTASREDA
jgi:PTS system nitrogen regulatory IIA component